MSARLLPIYSTDNLPVHGTEGKPLYYAVLVKALITIDASPGRMMVYCGYWVDNAGYPIGASYSEGSLTDDNYTAVQYGYGVILLWANQAKRSTKEADPYQYRVHVNFQEVSGSGSLEATVIVRRDQYSSNSLSKTITPSRNAREPATTDDPYVTITFADDGTPIAIE